MRPALPVAARGPAIYPALLTRHLSYHRDKLSRLAPPSELSKCDSPYGIRGLAKGGLLAPVLPMRLAYILPKSSQVADLTDTVGINN
jgi:hypothetical protein